MQIAVHISHHKVKAADRGLVVVGGTVRYGDLSDDAVAVDADQNDVIDKELLAEETERLHARGGACLLSNLPLLLPDLCLSCLCVPRQGERRSAQYPGGVRAGCSAAEFC